MGSTYSHTRCWLFAPRFPAIPDMSAIQTILENIHLDALARAKARTKEALVTRPGIDAQTLLIRLREL
jgi:hypothetical protein